MQFLKAFLRPIWLNLWMQHLQAGRGVWPCRPTWGARTIPTVQTRPREAQSLGQNHRAGIPPQATWPLAVPLVSPPLQTDPFLGMMMGLGGGMDFDSKKAYR